MRMLLAWRMLLHSKVRSSLAVAGTSLAILLIFVQLGFHGSVLTAATQIYDRLDFDLVLMSRDYSYLARAGTFPRRRVFQARRLPEVEKASPFYVGFANWVRGDNRTVRQIFLMGTRLSDQVFLVPEVNEHDPMLKLADTAIVDRDTRSIFGPQRSGTIVEVGGRDLKLVGQYSIGTGFIELGALIVSDQNFHRLASHRSQDDVSLGLIKLREGTNPENIARQIQQYMPEDVDVLSRKQLNQREQQYWALSTSTGMVFGFGVIVAFIVGTVILYQTLSSQILIQLPRLATMKAMGFSDGYLAVMIVLQSVLLVAVGFPPALIGAVILYRVVNNLVYLSLFMPISRVALVFTLTMSMSILAGLLALRKVQLADPADLM